MDPYEVIKVRLKEHDEPEGRGIPSDCAAENESLPCCLSLKRFNYETEEWEDNPFRVALDELLAKENLELDNHHNALTCPYCNRRRDEQERKIRALAFEDAAEEMDRLVEVMREEQTRVKRLGVRDWTSGYIADREGHAVWLRDRAKAERSKEKL